MARAERYERVVKGELDEDVDEVDGGEGYFVDEYRAHSVEEDLEGAEECLAKHRIKKYGFEGGGEVSV